MYNLSEYIILSRSAYLLDNASIVPTAEYSDYDYETLFNIDKNIENLFISIFDGATISKFIIIRNEECEVRKYYPLYLLEVPSYKDGKTLILPMALIGNGLCGIKTIFPYSDAVEMQPFLFEIMSIYPLRDKKGSVEFFNFLQEVDFTSTYLTEIKSNLEEYFDTSGYILNNINNTFSSLSEFNINPISLDNESDKYANYIKNSYILDTPRENKIQSMPIRPEMFMPLVVKVNNPDGEATNKVLSLYYSSLSKPSDYTSDSVVLRSEVVDVNRVEEINNIVNKDGEGQVIPNKVFVQVPDKCEYIIIDSTCMVYVGEGKLFTTIIDSKDEEKGSMNYLDLNRLVLNENESISSTEESPYLNPLSENVSTESLVSNFKDLVKKGKEAGINVKSDVMPYLRKLVGLPKDLVHMIYKYVLRIFNKANEMEKNKSLDYQEKLLNDEISEFSETMEKLVSNGVVAIGVLLIPTSFIIQVIIFLIGKSVNEQIRLRALERMEHRLEDIIDRLDKKIEFANQDYDKKAVNELKKQRSLYIFAFERILKVKKKVYGKGRKDSAFREYDEYKEGGNK